jgi:ABC-type sugar transport system substrate-binding protein
VDPAGVGEAAGETTPAETTAAAAALAAAAAAGTAVVEVEAGEDDGEPGEPDPGIGHGQAGPIAFEFVRSAHVPVGAGGVSAAINCAMSELPSSIGWTCRFMREF